MTLLVVLFLFVPGVYGVTISVSGGDGVSGSTVGLGISAAKDASVNGEVSVIGAFLVPTKAPRYHQSGREPPGQDSDGNHAEIHAYVVKGQNPQYTDNLVPEEGNLDYSTGVVMAVQTLTVGLSDYIKCSQIAFTLSNDHASDGIEIYSGSLTNYRGAAYAARRHRGGSVVGTAAYVKQRFDAAAGKSINVQEYASNNFGLLGTNTKISDGSISLYSPLYTYFIASSGSLPLINAGDGLHGENYFESASGKTIELGSYASMPDGSTSSTTTTVRGSSDKNGLIGNQWTQIADEFGSIGSVYQIFDASGDVINTAASASDSAGNKASGSSKLTQGTIISANNAAAIDLENSVGALVDGGTVTGSALILDAEASNAARVPAKQHTTVPKVNSASYINNAQVDLSTGTPTVEQHVP